MNRFVRLFQSKSQTPTTASQRRRQRKARRRACDFKPRFEALEERRFLSADSAISRGDFLSHFEAGDVASVIVAPAALTAPATSSPTSTAISAPIRSIDGTGNNLAHPQWGSTDEQLLRKATAEYGDGISSPAGSDRPSAREISNALATHGDEDTPSNRSLTAYIYVWGQFLDHDMDLTKSASPTEPFNITVPAGDPSFDPNSTGTQIIPLTRSVFDASTGTSSANPRQQINQITAWIDGSMIYGSDATRAAALRTFTGGKLKVQSTAVGDLPPLNTAGLPNANDAHRAPDNQLFLAGDIRANENIELTSMHTLFIREHNSLADQIAKANPSLSDEQIFQQARAIVIGEIQVITYMEWLPALLGAGAISSYRGYNANVNPGIANEFSTAAFRLHSTINDDVEFFDNNGRPITFDYTDDYGGTITVEGEVALLDAFFNPTMFGQTGVDGILKYAASTHAEEVDNQIVDSLRDFLFGQPGQGGLDLASLNIQRGRDHGLADYNAVRAAYGLPRVSSFSQITSDPEIQAKLKDLYGDVNNIDLWVGALAEDHVRGSSVGPLMQRVIGDQFQRLRDGDRYWYQRVFSGAQLAALESTKLSDIIERNTGVTSLQYNVFLFRAEAGGRVFLDANGDGLQGRGENALAKVSVELLNDEGEVIASTVTGLDGRYRFTQFPETGDFQVRVVTAAGTTLTTPNPRDFSIAKGDVALRNLDFGLRRADTPLVDDSFEENDSLPAARDLGTLIDVRNVTGLVMADSQDWFRFSMNAAGAASDFVAMAFQNSQGNLALELYNASGQRIGSSNGATAGERLSLSGVAAGTYYVRVFGSQGATNPSYSLQIDPAAPTTQPPATGSFDIQFSFSGLSANQQSIFEQAAAKWETIIVGDLPNATFNGQDVDDLLIGASATPIDGRGNVLAQAGPDRFRAGSLLPYHGAMQFDTADLASMEANGTLLGVIEHEMGHVLGIGTIWSAKGLLSGARTGNPRFTGPQATAQYNALFGTSAAGVPVESGGGGGTRDAHWSESVFGNELMTGFLSIGPGATMPISRITVASLADLGYSVNIAAADPYTPPRASTSLVTSAGSSDSAGFASLVVAESGADEEPVAGSDTETNTKGCVRTDASPAGVGATASDQLARIASSTASSADSANARVASRRRLQSAVESLFSNNLESLLQRRYS